MHKTPSNKSLNKSNTLFKYFSKSPATTSPAVSGSKTNVENESKSEEANVKTDGNTSHLAFSPDVLT